MGFFQPFIALYKNATTQVTCVCCAIGDVSCHVVPLLPDEDRLSAPDLSGFYWITAFQNQIQARVRVRRRTRDLEEVGLMSLYF